MQLTDIQIEYTGNIIPLDFYEKYVTAIGLYKYVPQQQINATIHLCNLTSEDLQSLNTLLEDTKYFNSPMVQITKIL